MTEIDAETTDSRNVTGRRQPEHERGEHYRKAPTRQGEYGQGGDDDAKATAAAGSGQNVRVYTFEPRTQYSSKAQYAV